MREGAKLKSGVGIIAHRIAIQTNTGLAQSIDKLSLVEALKVIWKIKINGVEAFDARGSFDEIKRVGLAVEAAPIMIGIDFEGIKPCGIALVRSHVRSRLF